MAYLAWFTCWIFLTVLVSFSTAQDSSTDTAECTIDPNQRFDCHPEVNATKEICEGRGCCWLENDMDLSSRAQGLQPVCFFPTDFPAYVISDVTDTPLGFSMDLQKNETAFYPREVTVLKVDIMYESDSRLRVKVIHGLRLKTNITKICEIRRWPFCVNNAYTISCSLLTLNTNTLCLIYVLNVL